MKALRLRFLRVASITLVILVSGTAVARGQTTTRDSNHEGQTPGTHVSRTAWGDPDLQGIWVGSTLTPLERPERHAGREFLTDEEVAELENPSQMMLKSSPRLATSRADRTAELGFLIVTLA